jgi:hypothetical protein
VSGLARFKDLCMDAADHQAQADWWCAALGYQRREPADGAQRPPEDPVLIADPEDSGPMIWVVPVAEAKVVKNRMHIDVFGRLDDLLAAGATLVRAQDDDIGWDVMADPEGNEFCVFEPR